MPKCVLEKIPEVDVKVERCQVDAKTKIDPVIDAKPEAVEYGNGVPPVNQAFSQKSTQC